VSISEIEDYIKQEATKEMKKILDETDKKKAEIEEKTKKEATELRQNLINEGRRLAKLEKIKIISEANINQKKEIEAKKEEIIVQCLDEAQKELNNLRNDSKKYSELLKSYVNDAKTHFGNEITILCDPKDRDTISKLGYSPETTISTNGGIIVMHKDGKSQLDYRFENRYSAFKPDLRKEIAKILFT